MLKLDVVDTEDDGDDDEPRSGKAAKPAQRSHQTTKSIGVANDNNSNTRGPTVTHRAAHQGSSDTLFRGDLSTDGVCAKLVKEGFSAEGNMREVLERWSVIEALGKDKLDEIDWKVLEPMIELPQEANNDISRLADELSDRSVEPVRRLEYVKRFLRQSRRPSRRGKSKAEITVLEEAEKLMGLSDPSIDIDSENEANCEVIVRGVRGKLGSYQGLGKLLDKQEGGDSVVPVVRCIRRVLDILRGRLENRNSLCGENRHWPRELVDPWNQYALRKFSAGLEQTMEAESFDKLTELLTNWRASMDGGPAAHQKVLEEAERDAFAFQDKWFAKFVSYLKVVVLRGG
jgi:hypothetical protein